MPLRADQVTIVWDADLVNHFERYVWESNTTLLRELQALIASELEKRGQLDAAREKENKPLAEGSL